MKRFALVVSFAGCVAVLATASTITTEFYQINSGAYAIIGGFIGEVTHRLPDTTQWYLQLRFHHDAGTARMRILGEDGEAEFAVMTAGRIVGGQILFSNVVRHPLHPLVLDDAVQEYRVQLGDASVWVDGSVRSEVICCDIPHTYLHRDVHATILDGPPANPVGVYDYRGYDEIGILVVTGVVAVTTGIDPIEGSWHLSEAGPVGEIGPQIGRGILGGTRNGQGLTINLNPGVVDNTVYLDGTLSGSLYAGVWEYSTFVGTTASGTFQAEKRTLLVSITPGPAGQMMIGGQWPAGMDCAVEFTDAIRGGQWEELSRFTTTGQPQWIEDDTPRIGRRFYRIRVLDATGTPLVPGESG